MEEPKVSTLKRHFGARLTISPPPPSQVVAVTAGEAANPRKTVPKAIRRVFYRILLFYIGGVAVIGLTVP